MEIIAKRGFINLIEKPKFEDIKYNDNIKNLSDGYWVYDALIQELEKNNWIRFAPGFKAGVYGHSEHKYCIKILGMGVGDDPKYFCEKGNYIEHERNMMMKFRNNKFTFLPEVLTQEDSIRFLVEECKISKSQAEERCFKNDILITEYIPGIAMATQTGQFLDQILNVGYFSEEVIFEMEASLYKLKEELDCANRLGLLHNDPMPPNIIFTVDKNERIIAKLVDFELSQDINVSSPSFVDNAVKEQYKERDVPLNNQTGKYKKNLDQHLMELSIELLQNLPLHIRKQKKLETIWDSISITIPFVGIGINLGGMERHLRKTKN